MGPVKIPMQKSISLTVGQVVYIDGKRPVTVEKIGSKWVTFKAEASYSKNYRALIGSRRIDRDFGSDLTIYLSPEEYQNEQAIDSAWLEFRRLVSSHYGSPNLTLEQVTLMLQIVKESQK